MSFSDVLFLACVLVNVCVFAIFAYDSWRREEEFRLGCLGWREFMLLMLLVITWLGMGILMK